MILVTLTEPEVKVLMEALEIHEEGLRASKQPTIEDRTIETIDMLLSLMDGYEEDLACVESIRKKVTDVS